MKVVSENIRKYREAASFSPRELASRITVTKKNVAGWECGSVQPDLETLKLIATALDVDVMDLIYGKSNRKDAFLREKPRRVRITILLAVVCGVFLISAIFVMHVGIPKGRPNILYHAILAPVVYASGAATLASFWTIWYNFSISSRILREGLFSLGIICVFTYYVDFILQYVTKLHFEMGFCLYKHPMLFVLPGALFFLGCNKGPSE